MATVTKYAGKIAQDSGGKFRTFENLTNINNNVTGSYSESSGLIQGKNSSPNTPSTLYLSKFGFNLPTGALVKKITVEYRFSKLKYGGHVCNIPAPTITLRGLDGFSGKGQAPTTTLTTYTKTFTTSKPTASQVNSNDFGVRVTFPANTNNYQGYMRISYIRLKVEYVDSSYTVGLNRVSGGYNGNEYTVQASISNKNLTNHNPTVTIVAPAGFSFTNASGTGTATRVDNRTVTWDPKLSSKVGTVNIDLTFQVNVVYPSGSSSYTGTFSIGESYSQASSTHTAVITDAPEEVTPVEEEGETIIDISEIVTEVFHTEVEEEFTIDFELKETDYDSQYWYRLYCDNDRFWVYWKREDGSEIYEWVHTNTYLPVIDETHKTFSLLFKFDNMGVKHFQFQKIKTSDGTVEVWREFYVDVRPAGLNDTPNATILTLTDEELSRLGHNIPYIAQSYINVTSSNPVLTDWGCNFRIGVFNNAINENVTVTETTGLDGETIDVITDTTDYDNLTIKEIIDNAEYWSQYNQDPNTYNSSVCEFAYNEEYPFYIILTGDYPSGSGTSIKYTNPCIIEHSQYNGYEDTGTYPVPFQSQSLNEDSAELTLESQTQSSPMVFYDFDLEEEYGTSNDLAIKGIAVTGNIEQSDQLILYASLCNPNGLTGERSILINNSDLVDTDNTNNLTIGGLGDLWGFTTGEIQEFKDWEIRYWINNLLNDYEANINYNNLQLALWVEPVEHQEKQIKIEDEDIAYYGAFIQDVVIPEGLETDTDYLTIDGTDTNDAYRQNIREKTIEIEVEIGDCNLTDSTNSLRQFTKLLVNERDKYNRPIPKSIWFSHYPDVYFEYVLEDTIDAEAETTYYKVKAKLTIPSGTAFKLDDTVTNTIGYVQGYAAVNPVIQITPNSTLITLNETITNQTFNINYTGDYTGKIIEIDCNQRKAYLKTDEEDTQPIDISSYVDINSDWFHLQGEYQFQSTGATIRTITYTERW